MPKLGAEPIRKAALINAAIFEVGRAGSLAVTVAYAIPSLLLGYFSLSLRELEAK